MFDQVLEIDDPVVVLAKSGDKKPERKQAEEQKTPEKDTSSRLDLSSYLPTPSQDIDPDTKISFSGDEDGDDLGFEIDTKGEAGADEDLGFVVDTKGATSNEDKRDSQSQKTDSSADQSPVVKKLKRRNVAMYKSEDSD